MKLFLEVVKRNVGSTIIAVLAVILLLTVGIPVLGFLLKLVFGLFGIVLSGVFGIIGFAFNILILGLIGYGVYVVIKKYL